MDLLDTLIWYGENILDYTMEMLPCMLAASAAFLALLPLRQRHLAARRQVSGPWREAGLFLFVVFCAGLAALTVFPAGFWRLSHWEHALRGEGLSLRDAVRQAARETGLPKNELYDRAVGKG